MTASRPSLDRHNAMPFLRIQTNIDLASEDKTRLAQACSHLVSELLGKSKDFVQVIVEGHQSMVFGDSTEPTVFVELRSLGLNTVGLSPLAAEITRVLRERLDVDPKRVFLNFFDLSRTHWGWNGKTFE